MSRAASEPTLRRDAQRNLERLRAAALEVFAEQGLGAPLEAIAQRAGVSIGTLYNRFSSREQLIDAVVPELLAAKLDAASERALAGPDPWSRFAVYVEELLAMQADDPALSDVFERAYPSTVERIDVLCRGAMATGQELIEAAQADGTLRRDFTSDDLFAEIVANGAVVRHYAGRPDAWRRRVRFLLDGLRAVG